MDEPHGVCGNLIKSGKFVINQQTKQTTTTTGGRGGNIKEKKTNFEMDFVRSFEHKLPRSRRTPTWVFYLVVFRLFSLFLHHLLVVLVVVVGALQIMRNHFEIERMTACPRNIATVVVSQCLPVAAPPSLPFNPFCSYFYPLWHWSAQNLQVMEMTMCLPHLLLSSRTAL